LHPRFLKQCLHTRVQQQVLCRRRQSYYHHSPTYVTGGGGVRAAPASATAAPPAAAGRGATQFHLTPSKKAPKLDLGEAYLRAQENKVAAATASAQSKARCDLVIALTMQGKTAVEIAAFLLLCGL
jgi:hypothetical protein